MLDGRFPQGRFSDPGLALEHQRGGPTLRFADEGIYGGEFRVPADDFEHDGPRNDGDRGRDKSNLDNRVKFTRSMTKGVQAELEDLASWLGLDAVEILMHE